jgi:hypothetical protein
MKNILGGYRSATSQMAAAMSGCNKCATQTCEDLAKLVAHKWLASWKIPEGPPKANQRGCSPSAMDAAYKVAWYIDNYGGVDLRGNLTTKYNSPANNEALRGIIKNWSQCIGVIQTNLNCNGNCATQACEQCAKDVAKAWIKANPNKVASDSSGGAHPKKQTKTTDTDADCDQFGPFKGVCVAWKGFSKGVEGAAQNPLNQYMPLMLLGFGMVAVIILLKK